MNNRLLALYLANRRAALLGKAGLLAMAMTLAPLALTANGVVREEAYAASDVPGLDDPATHDTADNNAVDNSDGNDVGHGNGADGGTSGASDGGDGRTSGDGGGGEGGGGEGGGD
jgi:hypothetical protein